MTTDTNKTASQMLFHELAANGGTRVDIVDRLLNKPPVYSLTNFDIAEAAQEIILLRRQIAVMEKRDEKYQRFIKFFAEELGDIR
jgi:hypothetical protein